MRCVIVVSTGGSVMNELLKNAFFRRCIHAVVSDRECPAVAKAQRHGLPTHMIRESDRDTFSDRLLEFLEAHRVDYVLSFFTKLFTGRLLNGYRDRIVNLHPSLLPAFKGMNGFGDTVRYGARYIGSTIHFIDERMDEGKIILQAVAPLDPELPLEVLRHKVFEQQCRSLLQVVRWLHEGRILIRDGRVVVAGAGYTGLETSPDLDDDEARALSIPLGRGAR